MALVPISVPAVHISLAGGAESKGPPDRHSEGLFAVGSLVNTTIPVAQHFVRIGAVPKSELLVGSQDFAFSPGFERMRHGSCRLCNRLSALARRRNRWTVARRRGIG